MFFVDFTTQWCGDIWLYDLKIRKTTHPEERVIGILPGTDPCLTQEPRTYRNIASGMEQMRDSMHHLVRMNVCIEPSDVCSAVKWIRVHVWVREKDSQQASELLGMCLRALQDAHSAQLS